MSPFRSILYWAAIGGMIATLTSRSFAQWTPPQSGLVAVGVKTGARVASSADTRVGPSITITQPSPSSAFWALWSKSENSVSFNMPPYGWSGHTVVSVNQQADPVSWNVRPMLDAHCNASWQGSGYINHGSLCSESGFQYSCVPAKGVTRKVAWIYLTAHGSPNVFLGTADEIMRVDLAPWFVRVLATSRSASTPSQFVIQTFLPSSNTGTDALVSTAPMDIVNHLVMIQYPENATFTGGSVQSRISGNFNRLPTGATGTGQKFLSAHTWLMWDDAPRVKNVVPLMPSGTPLPTSP